MKHNWWYEVIEINPEARHKAMMKKGQIFGLESRHQQYWNIFLPRKRDFVWLYRLKLIFKTSKNATKKQTMKKIDHYMKNKSEQIA